MCTHQTVGAPRLLLPAGLWDLPLGFPYPACPRPGGAFPWMSPFQQFLALSSLPQQPVGPETTQVCLEQGFSLKELLAPLPLTSCPKQLEASGLGSPEGHSLGTSYLRSGHACSQPPDTRAPREGDQGTDAWPWNSAQLDRRGTFGSFAYPVETPVPNSHEGAMCAKWGLCLFA